MERVGCLFKHVNQSGPAIPFSAQDSGYLQLYCGAKAKDLNFVFG